MPLKNKARKILNRSAATTTSLVPGFLVFPLFFVAFALPNIVFSGNFFFQTLHLMKWTLAAGPIALLGIIAGYRALRRGAQATNFRIDGFAALWLLLLLYTAAQPLWTSIRSVETWYLELLFFASLWLLYVLASALADRSVLRVVLWGALLNAVLSVGIAELQLRGLHVPYSFILPAPGQYLANTGQQNMFALWLAITALGGSFLFLTREKGVRRYFSEGTLLVCISIVYYGLISTTSRSGILALVVGFSVLCLFFLRLQGNARLRGMLLLCAIFAIALAATIAFNEAKTAALTSKLEDVVENPLSIAKRDSIWATSWTMFSAVPWQGVGLGQFKWNYIDAVNLMLQRWPNFKWHYTNWAHNEFLQWMAESGIVGSLLMFFLWFWWGFSMIRAFWKKTPLSEEAIWGNALVALFFFNALWTRPFHRAENVVWLSLAFAAANRETLLRLLPLPSSDRFEKTMRLFAGAICVCSLLGLFYLADGMRGDRFLRLAAENPQDASAMKSYFDKASKSPMVRDIAERQTAYFKIKMGEITGDKELMAEGLNELLEYFRKQPTTSDLAYLQSWVPVMRNERFVEYVLSFTRLAVPASTSVDAAN